MWSLPVMAEQPPSSVWKITQRLPECWRLEHSYKGTGKNLQPVIPCPTIPPSLLLALFLAFRMD